MRWGKDVGITKEASEISRSLTYTDLRGQPLNAKDCVQFARLRRAVLKDQALGVFVSEVSSPFDWVRQFIADRLVQASGIALESSETRIRLPVDDEKALHSALDALGIVSEAGPVDQLVLVKVVSDAAFDDLAISEEIRHDTDHERSTNSTGMW